MAFFAEDVHILASASMDGRVYVWKITECPDEEDKPQITGRIVTAIQVTGEGKSVRPRICWHCHKQEVLVVGIGRLVLKIDTTKVGKGEKFSAEEPLNCPTDKLINGIQLVGSHDGEVTDLSMCQWMTTRLVSASVDGTIKIWDNRKSLPIAVLRPNDGQPVHSVTFFAAPHRPDHIILITGGALNREMKIWISASEEGWLLPSDAESWHCTQTLVLKSSEGRLEEAFFNQVVSLPQAGLLVLANAKRNAIYAVHLEYGPNPAATRFNYISEFSVTMPILSFIGTSELLPHGEQIVQVYCVQTQAIQQYALDLSQCLPSPVENVPYEKSDSSFSHDVSSSERFTLVEPSDKKPADISVSSSAPITSMHESGLEKASKVRHPVNATSVESPTVQEFSPSGMESKTVSLTTVVNESDTSFAPSRSLPLSPRVSRTISGFRTSSNSFEHVSVKEHTADQKIAEYSVDRQIDTSHANLSDVGSLDDNLRNDDSKLSQDDNSMSLNHPIKFKHPTHLVTPAEILMASSPSEMNHLNEPPSQGELSIPDVIISNDTRNVEVEVKIVGETKFDQNDNFGSSEHQVFVSENKEKSFCSQASDLGMEMSRECCTLSSETYIVEEGRQLTEANIQPSIIVEEVHDSSKDVIGKVVDSSTQHPEPSTKGKKQKEKSVQGSGLSSRSCSTSNLADSLGEPGISSNTTPVETAASQILSMQEILNQVMTMQKEMQKQMESHRKKPAVDLNLLEELPKSFHINPHKTDLDGGGIGMNEGYTGNGTTVIWGRISKNEIILAVDTRGTSPHNVEGRKSTRLLRSDKSKKYYPFYKGVIVLSGNAGRGMEMLKYVQRGLDAQGKKETLKNITDLGVQFFVENALDTTGQRGSTVTICGWVPFPKKFMLYAIGDKFTKGSAYPTDRILISNRLYGCGSGSDQTIENLKKYPKIKEVYIVAEMVHSCLTDLSSGGA